MPKIGSINIHNGKIPKYRGHFGTFWENLNKEKNFYTCIHRMEEKVDSGSILSYCYININNVKTFLGLLKKKKGRGGQMLALLLQKIDTNKKLPDNNINQEIIEEKSTYYGWPSVKDIKNFNRKNIKKVR